ncbi:hypothetical protein DSL72_001075 [Monilinia vaccinii-corymbosi]|uniref:Isochorismatase-like domain-containing protein n=1 Tax=Monilinia vaccinii-corymbosi TaxID=61207 RepID=A0A8A3P905_9HELO|nr:hypothetical protein DSL72_001075 [Monilinia vaccinii-corymbosi]
MEGSNGPSVYQQICFSSINIGTNAADSPTIVPIVETHQILSKVHTNGDLSVASDKIYDEIDELKFKIKTRAASEVIITETKSTKSRRSSFLSKLLNFHRNPQPPPPRSISISNHYQALEHPSEKDRVSSTTPPKPMDYTMDHDDDDENSLFVPDNRKLAGQFHARPYNWPHDSTLDPATTALVIIDMQKDFASDKGYLAKQGIDNRPILNIVPKIRKILDVCRASGFPIYHTREGHRPDLSTLSSREKFRSRNNKSELGIGDMGPLGRLLIRGEEGHGIIDELTPLENEPVIDKPGRSAFQHTEFRLMLNIKGIKNLIICGVTTDVCVTSTMREANDNNFDCVLVEDACAAGVNAYHKSAVDSITEEGGIFGAVTTFRDVLEQLGTNTDQILSQDIIKSEKYSKSIGDASIDNLKSSSANPTQTDQPSSISPTSVRNNQNIESMRSVRLENRPPPRVGDYIDDGTQPRERRTSGKRGREASASTYLLLPSVAQPVIPGNNVEMTKRISLNDISDDDDDDDDDGDMPLVLGGKIVRMPKYDSFPSD